MISAKQILFQANLIPHRLWILQVNLIHAFSVLLDREDRSHQFPYNGFGITKEELNTLLETGTTVLRDRGSFFESTRTLHVSYNGVRIPVRVVHFEELRPGGGHITVTKW